MVALGRTCLIKPSNRKLNGILSVTRAAFDAYGRSLALFCLPLIDAHMERNATGANVLTQWFERARFEHHPNNAPPFNVLLGRLGAESQ